MKTCRMCSHGDCGVCYNCYGVDGVTEINDKGSCKNWFPREPRQEK